MAGPLSAFAPGFLEDLFRQGYRPETAAKQLQLMAHLSRWLAGRKLDGSELDGSELLIDRRGLARASIASATARSSTA